MNKAEKFLREHGHIPVCGKINPDYAPLRYDYVIYRETLHELFRIFASEYARQESITYKNYLMRNYGYTDRPINIPDSSYDDFINQQEEKAMKGNCEVCGAEIEIKLCCSGFECGCMGIPTEPPVCSEECYKEFKKKYQQEESNVKP